MSKRTAYETDLTEAQWQLLEPLLPPPAREGRPIEIARREIVNAILYKLKGGCHWRLLPHDLPKWQTVYYYYRKWRADGTLVLLHDQLRTQLRIQMGREPEPQIAIIDSQSVKTTEKGGEHGYDAGKKINGRKRHIAVDSQGFLLSIVVHSANLVDRLGAPLLLWRMGLPRKWPRLELIYADGGYSGPIVSAASEQLGCKLEISSPPPGTKGFAPVPQRWKVERTFGWLGRSRQLSKEYDVLTDCSEGWVYWAMTKLMLRRLVAT